MFTFINDYNITIDCKMIDDMKICSSSYYTEFGHDSIQIEDSYYTCIVVAHCMYVHIVNQCCTHHVVSQVPCYFLQYHLGHYRIGNKYSSQQCPQ